MAAAARSRSEKLLDKTSPKHGPQMNTDKHGFDSSAGRLRWAISELSLARRSQSAGEYFAKIALCPLEDRWFLA
jgi:hypothetical protein